MAGSVTGGCVEPAVYGEARDVLAGGAPRLKTYGIADDEAFEVGLPCGGTVHIFVDRLDPELVAPIAEAVREERPIALEISDHRRGRRREAPRRPGRRRPGRRAARARRDRDPRHAGGPALRLVLRAPPEHVRLRRRRPRRGGRLDRPLPRLPRHRLRRPREVRHPERFPDVDELVVEWPDRFLAEAPVDERTVICVLTHDHKFDVPALKVALETNAGYIGAMGARRTNADRAERLRAEGVSDEDIARIHAPIGLKIGSRTPEEVAVAIAAADRRRSCARPSPHPRGGRRSVKLENSFEVAAPPEKAWDLLMDVPRIVPCMPGAKLDEVVDDDHWKATMQVKLGPISLTFATDVERKEADEAARRVVLGANARETRNRGRASATIESTLAPTRRRDEGRHRHRPLALRHRRPVRARDDRGHLLADGHELRPVPAGPARRVRRRGGTGGRRPGEADLRVLTLLRQPLAPHPTDRKEVELRPIEITVNEKSHSAEVEPRQLLVYFLREQLGLTGTVVGCDTSSCGACTVLLDGESVKSCTVLAVQADGREVTTIEALSSNGDLNHVQQAFHENHGLQCGFCTPGMVMATVSLLEENPSPSEEEIRHALEGNLCRCTGYQNIVKAVKAAAAA